MLFIAKKRGLRLIKRPTDIITDENRRTQVIRGEKVEFVNGRYQTTNQDLIDWMIGNKDKGIPPHEEFKRGVCGSPRERDSSVEDTNSTNDYGGYSYWVSFGGWYT